MVEEKRPQPDKKIKPQSTVAVERRAIIRNILRNRKEQSMQATND